MIKEKADVDRIFNDQLEKTGAGYFDYYLLHAVSKDKLDIYDGFDCWNYCLEKKKEGKIKHFGFSFHDTAEVLDEILTNHPEAEFVQLQLNYLDWDNDAVQAKLCYEVAEKHNMPVIVMEPVKGGTLARLPESVESIFKAKSDASAASWAIRFAASQKNVFMVLSGMSDEAQMNDNIATMEDFQPLSECEIETVNKAVEEYKSFNTVPCTACRYCTDGCPVSIRIPDVISALNQAKVYGLGAKARGMYEKAVEDAGNPADCISCGQCSAVCPQHLDIPSIMKEASLKFAKKEN
jgi:predicted aldo/keto reductase-like oxidoreductase